MRTRVPARGRLSSKPFEFQPQKCFGNRQETHAQFSCDFTPGDHLADGYFAAENALANNYVSFTGEV